MAFLGTGNAWGGTNGAVPNAVAPINPNLHGEGIEARHTQQEGNDAAMQQLMASLGSQGQLAQLQAQTGLQQTGMQTSAATTQAQIAAEAAKYPTQVRQQEFNQLLPTYMRGMDTLNNAAASGFATGTSATGANQPTINAAPVFNPKEVNRQVNQSNATQDQATATQQRTNAQQAGGKGYASNSPLLSELNQSAQMAGNATKAQNEQGIRWNAAQGNSQQLLQGQTAQEQQYANRQNEALKRQSNVYGLAGSMIGGLSSALA